MDLCRMEKYIQNRRISHMAEEKKVNNNALDEETVSQVIGG